MGASIGGTWGHWDLLRSLGVIVGANQYLAHPYGLEPGATQKNMSLLPQPIGLLVGATYLYEAPSYWIRLSPSVTLTGLDGSGFNLDRSLTYGPPLIEVGWRMWNQFGMSLQTSVTPLKLTLTL